MKKLVLQSKSIQWVDYSEVQKSDYKEIAKQENLDAQVLQDYSSHEQLPKYEKDSPFSVLIFRVYDDKRKNTADKVQDLTTKIILFYSSEKLITIHRLPLEFLENLHINCQNSSTCSINEVLSTLFAKSVRSFERPLSELTEKIENFEESVFKNKAKKNALREGYYFKRQASAYRKIMKMNLDLMSIMNQRPDELSTLFLDQKDFVDRFYFYAEDCLENATVLMSLHLSISSQTTNEASFKTNEVMRILTVFSIFFLPLNFIAGLYGMNFEHMPELHDPNGYYIILSLMVAVAIGLYLWMFRQGWLKKPEDI